MGCKANLTDSQALEARLRKLGGASSDSHADVFLLNTCTVTDQADKEAKNILRKTKASLAIATGCLAQVDPETLQNSPSDSAQTVVLKNSAKEDLETLISGWLEGQEKAGVVAGDRVGWHKSFLQNHGPEDEVVASNRTRAFYKVQDGCDAFCAYCVIPLARGRSRSLPVPQILSELRALVESGVKEIVITAIHAADFASDGLDFVGLVEKILQEVPVPRLRLTSLDPAEIPDRLLALMEKDSRLCPHFHVSLQSASSRVLASMKRAYGAEQIEERLRAIAYRLPHAYVGMDVIAGFPGETDEEFQAGLQLLESLPFTRAHVFPFSVRRNTAAARMVEQGLAVPSHLIHARAKALRELSERKLSEALAKKVGSVVEVLVEEKKVQVRSRTCSFGHARNFHKVVFPAQRAANELVRVRIVGVEGEYLLGELL